MNATETLISSLEGMLEATIEHLPLLATGLVILAITWVAAKLIRRGTGRLTDKAGLRQSLSELFSKLVFIGVWVTGILLASTAMFPSFTPGKILTALGLSSIAIGFAFKDIFENFIAGILILLREPFEIGDLIECNDLEGTVEEITVRDTNIRRLDGQRVVVPNSMLFKTPVTVRTDRNTRRITIACGVGYDEDVAESRKVIQEALESCQSVNTDKPAQVYARQFGASSIDFDVTWWTGNGSESANIRGSRDEVVEAIKKALDDAGIEIPYPYRTLTFKNERVPIRMDEAA
ncbi:MAG: mechanosensitive ion channel family protein [Gammaproteobacteria bacterium]|nr:mechanosensitive ion channel family protein [Gammaproteobacteria bacterium]NNF61791.1 mechanosensitive ion channel family protein [Gammaproteobacteria bacterium]NNM19715.1 mechanosensitive ion channel family protein [Gammaproteobacteria bacterium]